MIEVYKCEHCGSIFENEEDCKEHEKNKHDATDGFRKIILDSIKKCNSMYNMKKQVYNIFIDVSCVVELDDEINMIEYYVCFMLDNDEIKICDNEFDISDNIRKTIEETYLKYIDKIEGKLTYKLGNYCVCDIKIKDLLKNKEGKIIKIEIYDEEIVKP